MGSPSILINSDSLVLSASGIFYATLAGGAMASTGQFIKMYAAGVVSHLGVRVSANATTGGTTTCCVAINSVDKTETFTVTTATAGYYEDATHTDSVASGDELNGHFVVGTGGAVTFKSVIAIFTPTTNTITKFNCSSSQSILAANTYYLPIAGNTGASFTSTETFQKVRMKHAGVMKNLYTSCSTGASNTSTYTVRQNGANSTMITAYTAGQNAGKEDVTHTFSVAVNDDINYSLLVGGTPNIIPQITSVDFESTAGYGTTLCAIASGYAQADATTEYHPIGGNMLVNTTESVAQVKAGAAFVFSNLRCMMSASDSPTATLTLMKGGVAQTQTFVTTASSTGLFEDTTHSDTFTAGDLIDIQVVASSIGGAHFATLTWIAMDSLIAGVTIPQTVWIEWEES